MIWTTIVAALQTLSGFFNKFWPSIVTFFEKWKLSSIEKTADQKKEDLRNEIDKFKDTGRPN